MSGRSAAQSPPANTDSPAAPPSRSRARILTVNDDDVGGTIELAAAAYSVAEDVASGMATITLTRTGGWPRRVTVRAQTGDLFTATTPPQTAAAGVDYTSTSTVVTFNAGDTTAVFNIPIVNDGVAPTASRRSTSRSTPRCRSARAPRRTWAITTAILRIVDATQTVGFTLANFDVGEAAGTAPSRSSAPATSAGR